MIKKFEKTNGWPVAAVALFIGLALVGFTGAQSGAGAGPTAANPRSAIENNPATAEGRPNIIATSPRVGETDVNPAITQITVTFDRDMGKGFSWTGGGADYPPSPAGQRAHWLNKRTCVLPVKLQAAHYYRVGINSKSYRNFRSAGGLSARPTAIYFTTRGAASIFATVAAVGLPLARSRRFKCAIASPARRANSACESPNRRRVRIISRAMDARKYSRAG